MSDDTDLAARVSALESTVQGMQQSIAALNKALGARQATAPPVLRSAGMLDRPKTGR